MKINWWRDIAIALFVGFVVLFLFSWNLHKDYLELYRSGVPVSEDARLVEYYKAIISNKCQIVERR